MSWVPGWLSFLEWILWPLVGPLGRIIFVLSAAFSVELLLEVLNGSKIPDDLANNVFLKTLACRSLLPLPGDVPAPRHFRHGQGKQSQGLPRSHRHGLLVAGFWWRVRDLCICGWSSSIKERSFAPDLSLAFVCLVSLGEMRYRPS